MPLAIPDELTVTKLKEAFIKFDGSGEVNVKQFGTVLDGLGVQAKALDKLLLFDFIDKDETGAINYMQFYNLIKENLQKFGECSASDLVLNIAYEHNMTKRGRDVRMAFKRGHNQTRVQSLPPTSSAKRRSRPASREASPKSVSNTGEEKKSAEKVDFHRSNRRHSHSDVLDTKEILDRGVDRDKNNIERLRLEEAEAGTIDDSLLELDGEFGRKRGASTADEFEDENEKQQRSFRIDSVHSEDMFKSPKNEDDFDFTEKREVNYDNNITVRPRADTRYDSLEDTLRFFMGESKSIIMRTLKAHKKTEISLLREIKKLASAGPREIPGNYEDTSMIKEDTQRYIKRVSAADLGSLNSEIDHLRKELRSLVESHNSNSGPEINRTLESIKQILSNVDDNLAFNLGTKIDHLESKLNRLLSIISKDKPKNYEPVTETELRDERKRLKDAMKFIESQVKKFKNQKSDYKNQIRMASEKIRKERKYLSREKERIKKESSAIKQQNIEIKERMHEVRAQKKLLKRKTSAESSPREIISPAKLDEIERMKETCAAQEKQLVILKNGIKENRKKFRGTINEVKKKNRYLENENSDLKNDVANSTAAVEETARKRKELAQQVSDLRQEKEGLIEQSGALIAAERQDKESIERERTYLAQMKQKLQDLAQKLTEERNNNEAAIELDQKAKSIASQMQLLADKRETLYTEREQFEGERNAVLAQWEEKQKELDEQEDIIKAMRKKKDAQANIMRAEYPRFKKRQFELEEQDKKNEEDENELKKSKDSLEKQLNELKEKTAKLEEQKVDIERRTKKLAEEEAVVKDVEKKLVKVGEDITVSKTKLQVKQDAFESIKHDFEKAAEKGKSDSHIKRLVSEEQERLRAEFDAEKKEMERAFTQKMDGNKDVRQMADQMIKEEKLVLEQERDRIQFLAMELHKTMDHLELERLDFEKEKKRWIMVIGKHTTDESVVKKICEKFEKQRRKKKKGSMT